MPPRQNPAAQPAEIVREYGPFPQIPRVHGVSFDGANVWCAAGDRLHALDPNSGHLVRALDVACDAGTAFDGTFLFQIDGDRIQKVEPHTGRVVATIPSPGPGCSGLTWAEGSLWVGQYRDRKILRVDPETGAVLSTIASDRFVTGVTFVDGELWHGVAGEGDGEVRHVDARTGDVLARLTMRPDVMVSGLESDGADLLYAGDGRSGRVRAIRRPRRGSR